MLTGRIRGLPPHRKAGGTDSWNFRYPESQAPVPNCGDSAVEPVNLASWGDSPPICASCADASVQPEQIGASLKHLIDTRRPPEGPLAFAWVKSDASRRLPGITAPQRNFSGRTARRHRYPTIPLPARPGARPPPPKRCPYHPSEKRPGGDSLRAGVGFHAIPTALRACAVQAGFRLTAESPQLPARHFAPQSLHYGPILTRIQPISGIK